MQESENTKSDNKPLSSRAIDAMKPGDKVKTDSGENTGLRIRCGKTGVKTFFYRYKSPETGKLVQIKLGHYPVLSLAEARIQLRELKILRKSGRCPKAEIEAQNEEEKRKAIQLERDGSFTVQALIDLYLEKYIDDQIVNDDRISGARKPKGQAEVRSTLYRDPVAVLGDLPASKVTRKHVVDMVMEIIKRGSNVQAGNVLRELSSAYEFAIGLGQFDDDFVNPALLAKASLRQTRIRLSSKRGTRVLSDKELIKLLKWIPGSVFTPTQKNILRFALWTGCRTGEICDAEWKDIDLDHGTWHLKATKTHVERYVQLPKQAVEFLKALKLVTGKYLFPSQKNGMPIQQKSLTEQAWHLRKTGRMLDIEHWTPHDLRRSVRTVKLHLKLTRDLHLKLTRLDSQIMA